MTEIATAPKSYRHKTDRQPLTLAGQFLLAGAAVLVAGILAIGLWVTGQIEAGVTRNTATATALYVDSVIAPLLEDIGEDKALSEGARRALDEILARSALGSRIVSFKLWKRGGRIEYSNRPELIGREFPPTENLKRAWTGEVAADFDELSDEENALERAEGTPLLEIYSPIREPWSGRVVAVAEFYEVARELKANIVASRLRSWLVVAGVGIAMMGLLFGIVLRGSRVIASQRAALETRVGELSAALAQNEELRAKVLRASSRAVALNERFLKRVSADLHDGPAQLLALASLRLGGAPPAPDEMVRIRGHLDDAMREIRDICRGLALPQIERLDLAGLLELAIANHAGRTGSDVALTVEGGGAVLTPSEKICVFRFVQEGLGNAFRHAGGRGQAVSAIAGDGRLLVSVSDAGPGMSNTAEPGEGLGLLGLRERVESLGGSFAVASSPQGTRLTMDIRLNRRADS